MNRSLKYWGEFVDVDDVRYRIEISVPTTVEEPVMPANCNTITKTSASGRPSGTGEEVLFPADSPLVIEWSPTDKIEPLCPSCATLKLISDKDRRFVELYAVDVTAVRLDVYRAGTLYWSGMLDTELYEEPYSFPDGYEVTLTFSDFAPLERLKWQQQGTLSLAAIIDTVIDSVGILYNGTDRYISTLYNGRSLPLEELCVSGDNFYDEQNKAMTLKEVLEAVLQPFALRIQQKAGRLVLYDLHALCSDARTENIEWQNTDATLSADAVYNNVRVTFSPYATSSLLDIAISPDNVVPTSGHCSFKMDYGRGQYDELTALDGFTIRWGNHACKDISLSNGARFFRIEPEYSGSEEAGIAYSIMSGDYSVSREGLCEHKLERPGRVFDFQTGSVISRPIITMPRVGINYLGATGGNRYRLKLSMQLFWDVRYNPFEPADNETNEGGNYRRLCDWANYAYVPFSLTLYGKQGAALYHYTNSDILNLRTYARTQGAWKTGAGVAGDAFLTYYDASNRKSASGLGGWKGNKQSIGWYSGKLPAAWEKMDEALYIPLPPAAGDLELVIYSGLHQFDNDDKKEKDIWSRTRWVLYKTPRIALAKSNGRDIDAEDIEDSAWLDPLAKEEYSIETVVGTMLSAMPTARGQLLDAAGQPVSRFTRAGVSDRLERLLIGTVYSQYHIRRTVLSGTARLTPGFGLLSDRSQPGLFLTTAEIQNCREATSEITLTEVVADDFQGIEYQQGN